MMKIYVHNIVNNVNKLNNKYLDPINSCPHPSKSGLFLHLSANTLTMIDAQVRFNQVLVCWSVPSEIFRSFFSWGHILSCTSFCKINKFRPESNTCFCKTTVRGEHGIYAFVSRSSQYPVCKMLSSRWLPPFLLLQVLQISICDDDWLSRMRARDEARMRYYELEEKREMINRERRSKETLKEKIAQVCFRVTMSKKLATMSKKPGNNVKHYIARPRQSWQVSRLLRQPAGNACHCRTMQQA